MSGRFSQFARGLPGGHRALVLADQAAWRARTGWLDATGQRRLALASYPRSGNTWFRFFLEAATGEQTGISATRQSRVLARGRTGVAIKTHQTDSYRYTHGIHLVRNPFDVLDSFFDWKASLGWDWKYGPQEWDGFVELMAPRWQEHTRHWLDTRCQTYLIRYEDCKRDPVDQFGKLLTWMGRPVPEDALRRAIEATSFEKLQRDQSTVSPVGRQFFRRGQANKGLDRYTPQQRRRMVDLLEPELVACGYRELVTSVRAGATSTPGPEAAQGESRT